MTTLQSPPLFSSLLLSPARTSRPDSILFFTLLSALYTAILAAKFSLWNSNVLQSDWTFFNNIFWNTNFRDLWLFSYDRFEMLGYVTYLNEHFAPSLIPFAALYQIMPWPEAFLLALHGASPIITAIGIRVIGNHVLKDRWLSTFIALVFAFNPGILWPTISLVYGFQPDCMLPPVAALVGYAIVTRRTGLFFAALLIGCTIKDNVPAYGVILGACLIVFTDWRKQGLLAIVLSITIFLMASKGVPYLTGIQNRNMDTVWRLIFDFLQFSPSHDYTLRGILFAAFYCLFFIPALFMLPYLAMMGPDVFATGGVTWATSGTWHVMLPVAVLGILSVFGSARFLHFQSRGFLAAIDGRISRVKILRSYWIAGLCLSLLAGPATLLLAYNRYIISSVPLDRGALSAAIKLVPPDVGLVTTNDLDQYFTRRRIVTSRVALLQKSPSDFSYLLVNQNALIPTRREGNAAGGFDSDKCLIAIANIVAKSKDTIILDQGQLLLVKIDALPAINCN